MGVRSSVVDQEQGSDLSMSEFNEANVEIFNLSRIGVALLDPFRYTYYIRIVSS